MSTVLCPEYGLPMVWMRGRWRCQCKTEIPESRDGARLNLLAWIELPEGVPADGSERWDVAEAVLAEHGLKFASKRGNRWIYHPAEHACTALVEIEHEDRMDVV